jgi:hypothetical protein
MNTFRRDCHEGHVDGGMMASYPAKLANPTVQQAGNHSYCCDFFEVHIRYITYRKLKGGDGRGG